MLLALQNSIRADERNANRDIAISKLPELVEYIPNIIPETDLSFLANIIRELESIGTLKPAADITSQWLSFHGEAYHFGGKGYESLDLAKFPHIQKLMDMVNNSPVTTRDANSCLINLYSDKNVAGRLHADNEAIVAQDSSICTVSIGVDRDIIFKRYSDTSKVIKTLSLENGSAFVMKPGCQRYLKHKLLKGTHGQGMRYSISFRRSVPEKHIEEPKVVKLETGTLLLASPSSSPSSCETDDPLNLYDDPLKTPPPIRLLDEHKVNPDKSQREYSHSNKYVLIIGDSYAKRLIGKKLGKGKYHIFNKSIGGANIRRTEAQIDNFFTSEESLTCEISHVFVSVCTNDIRYVYDRYQKLRLAFRQHVYICSHYYQY